MSALKRSRRVSFHPHLHILVSRGGLEESSSRWIGRLHFDRQILMQIWRHAVITYLRQALRTELIDYDLATADLERLLTSQHRRRWNIFIDCFASKLHFLRYAGRYVRHPPIAEHRFIRISDEGVEFLTKDLKEKRTVITQYSIEEFVSALAEHVFDRYQHAIRYFGLLSPRAKRANYAALFALLGQKQRPLPRRLSWQHSLRKTFHFDPLLDSKGNSMRWVRRITPAQHRIAAVGDQQQQGKI